MLVVYLFLSLKGESGKEIFIAEMICLKPIIAKMIVNGMAGK